MGKINKKKQKSKQTASQEKNKPKNNTEQGSADTFLESLNLPSDILENKISDDNKSVKSVKSIKNELGINKQLSKKDKIKLRQKVFLKKIATSTDFKNKIKKQAEESNSKKFKLNDNLPALGLNFGQIKVKVAEKKKKPIAKAAKRKKQLVRNVNIYKSIISDKNVIDNPFSSIMSSIKQKLEKGAI